MFDKKANMFISSVQRMRKHAPQYNGGGVASKHTRRDDNERQ